MTCHGVVGEDRRAKNHSEGPHTSEAQWRHEVRLAELESQDARPSRHELLSIVIEAIRLERGMSAGYVCPICHRFLTYRDARTVCPHCDAGGSAARKVGA